MPLVDLCTDSGCAREWSTIQLTQSTKDTLSVILRDKCGTPLAITPETHTVTLYVKEWQTGTEIYFSKPCTISSTTEGLVSCTVLPRNLPYAGIWVGEFTVTQIAEEDGSVDASLDVSAEAYLPVVVNRINCYVEVAQSIKASSPGTNRPLSIFEIRMAIRDRCPSDNTFLDELEFSNTEIMYALQRPIDYWNEALPPIPETYTYSTFPYKYHWSDAAIGELLKIASMKLMRNNIQINAGGVNLDDKGRVAMYMQVSGQLLQDYKAWVMQQKYSLNMNAWFGRISTPEFGAE
jgi:hypothetical protein